MPDTTKPVTPAPSAFDRMAEELRQELFKLAEKYDMKPIRAFSGTTITGPKGALPYKKLHAVEAAIGNINNAFGNDGQEELVSITTRWRVLSEAYLAEEKERKNEPSSR